MWLAAILTVTGVALALAWHAASLGHVQPWPTPRPTPSVIRLVSSRALYEAAEQAALKERPAATACSLWLEQVIEGGTLTYTAHIGFFLPDDPTWHMETAAWQTEGRFGASIRIKKEVSGEDSRPWPECTGPLRHPPVDSLGALQAMRRYGEAAMFGYFEEWPRVLRLVRAPEGGVIWEGTFNSRDGTDRLWIVLAVDTELAEVIEARSYQP